MLKRSALIVIEIFMVGILILAAGLFWVSYHIDTDEFRNEFAGVIQAATGREVTLDGELDISLWPGFNLEVKDMILAEDPAFGTEPFARFDRIRINVRLIPLMYERLDIRSVVVDGLELNIIEGKDGRLNYHSLTPEENGQPSGMASDFSFKEVVLHGLEANNASIQYRTATEKNGLLLSGINLRTGAIEPGEDVPFTVSSAFSWIDGGVKSDLILKGMFEAGFDGAGIALKDASFYASVGGAFLPEGANPGEMTARIVMDWDKRTIALDGLRVSFLGLRAEGNIESGDLSKQISANGHVTVHPFKPADIISRYFPNAPVKSVDGLKTSSLTSFFQIKESGVTFKNLALALDDMTVRGQLGFKGYSKPVFSFGLRGNSLNLDRYLPLFRTDTPFVWDDFGLGFFRAFRGQGAVRADGFKVLDTLISDIRLSIKADDKAILIDAGAIKEGQASLGGKTKLVIGKEEATGHPTLSLSAQLTAESQKEGFAFLQAAPLFIGGKGSLRVESKVSPMTCAPTARSIDILRHLQAQISLSLGEGQARYKGSKGEPTTLDYSKADISMSATSTGKSGEGYYEYDIASSLKSRGGTKSVESMSFAASGLVSTAVDKVHVKSSELDTKAHMTAAFMPREARRITASGKVSFDSETTTASLKNSTISLLDTAVKVSSNINVLDSKIKASGELEIAHANPKRIIYLLSGKSLRTEDAEALKRAGVAFAYSVDEDGFTLSDVKGKLDGVPLKGHIVGRGLVNPMLSFSLAAGKFDLDRYLPPSRKITPEERRSGTVKKAPPVDLPLVFLRALRLNGKATFEEFKLAKIRTQSVAGNIRTDKGIIKVTEVTGDTHGGKLTANWTGEVGTNSLKTQLKLHIEDMQAGPLMKDMAKRDYVRGETDVDIDLTSSGKTDDDILANLNGKTWARIRNGSFKFTGYNSKRATTKSNVNNIGSSAAAKPKPRTVFQKAMGYFSVNKGVFSVDKFRVEAPPLLQSYGSGRFSLPANTIDLSVRNDFIAVPSVTIRLTGKLTDPEMHVPKGKIVDDTVRNILSLPEKSFNFFRDLFH